MEDSERGLLQHAEPCGDVRERPLDGDGARAGDERREAAVKRYKIYKKADG